MRRSSGSSPGVGPLVLLALAQGLAVQELGRWLGPSGPSVERRWKLGVGSVLAGFRG